MIEHFLFSVKAGLIVEKHLCCSSFIMLCNSLNANCTDQWIFCLLIDGCAPRKDYGDLPFYKEILLSMGIIL